MKLLATGPGCLNNVYKFSDELLYSLENFEKNIYTNFEKKISIKNIYFKNLKKKFSINILFSF